MHASNHGNQAQSQQVFFRWENADSLQRLPPKKVKATRWNGIRELEQKERCRVLNEMCRGQTDRAGLGFKKNQKLLKDMKPQEHRKCLTRLVEDIDENDMLVYLYGCAKQGQWLRGNSAMQVDISMTNFHRQVTCDSGERITLDPATCVIIISYCTLFHILNGCR